MHAIERIRRFNRFYYDRMEFYTRDFAGTGRSVTELRILFEIVQQGGTTARKIANTLTLDEGYVSRILRRYEVSGWLDRRPADDDARRKTLHLTAEGRAAYDALHTQTQDHTRNCLGEADAEQVAEALDQAMHAFEPVSTEPVKLRDPIAGDAGWVVQRHAELYAAEHGLDWRMEAVVMRIMTEFLERQGANGTRGWIAHNGKDRLGSIFCMPGNVAEEAKLRLFLVEPSARGLGLGKRLMEACLDHARTAGFARMTLMTGSTLTTARALYARYGFVMTQAAPGDQFGGTFVEERWDIAF